MSIPKLSYRPKFLQCYREASAAAFTRSYQEFQRATYQQEPPHRVRGVLTDGFDSTTKSMREIPLLIYRIYLMVGRLLMA